MNTAEKRPVTSEEENKKLVHAWAHQLRRELPATHPAQSTLTAVIRHNYVPTFPVAKPLEQAEEAANLDTRAIIFFTVGAIGLVSAGHLFRVHPVAAVVVGVIGFIAQCFAFATAQPEDAS